jgi:DNA repair exonuclease SbcCD ATPase subunit
MISSLVLQNFQSHKKTILNFHENVNAIIGQSNSGKTAILRGLFWAIYNRPSGLSFISYWNRDKKGNPLKSTYSEINNGSSIKRIRNIELNGYKVNKDTLEAVGLDVPEQVSKLLNLSEVNIQKQMDAPFLLSESASEVARFLNKEIRLDLIDKILSNAESKRRKYNSDIKQYEIEISEIEKELEKFEILEEAERLNTQLNEVEILIESIEDKIEGLELLKVDYQKYVKIIQNYVKIPFKNIEEIISELDSIKKEENDIKEQIETLEDYKENYDSEIEKVKKNNTLIKQLEKEMPDTCPICGNVLEEDKC